MIGYISDEDYNTTIAGYSTPGWYWWGEGGFCYGPYASAAEAQVGEDKYAEHLEALGDYLQNEQKEPLLLRIYNKLSGVSPLWWWSLDCVCWFFAGVAVGWFIFS